MEFGQKPIYKSKISAGTSSMQTKMCLHDYAQLTVEFEHSGVQKFSLKKSFSESSKGRCPSKFLLQKSNKKL